MELKFDIAELERYELQSLSAMSLSNEFDEINRIFRVGSSLEHA